MITYQLTFYKKYYAQKYNIDPKSIETHFALVKRTAKKDYIELFRVTSGPKKTKGGVILADQTAETIQMTTVCAYVLKLGPLAYKDTDKFSLTAKDTAK